jgi:hypothetical protein
MIEGGVTFRDGLEDGEQESEGAESVGDALDEMRFAGDRLKFGGGRQKTVFEHVQLAGPGRRSSFFSTKYSIYRIDA